MKKIYTILLAVCLLMPMSACRMIGGTKVDSGERTTNLKDNEAAFLARLNEAFLEAFLAEDYEACMADFDDTMLAVLPAPKLEEAWRGVEQAAGTIEAAAQVRYEADDLYLYALTTLNCAYRGVLMRLTVTRADEKISGLYFTYTDKIEETALPEGIVEEDIVVGEDTAFALKGKLTLPAAADAADGLTAVVLVHGSGAQDMDETIYGNKPLRDIAHALAREGYAVLRYDKRTYTHAAELALMSSALTVQAETIEDAVAAKALLAADARINTDKIFVAGHSLGGMLTPRIAEEGGFAGGIILAGSPRRLVDIICMQNAAVIETLTGAEKDAAQALVDNELRTYEALFEAGDDDALMNTVAFGTAAYYYAEMDRNPAEGYLRKGKPYLVLQGKDDFQVSYEQDFKLFEAMNLPNLDCRAYDGLNHLFMDVASKTGTVADYEEAAQVDAAVLRDMAAWLGAQ